MYMLHDLFHIIYKTREYKFPRFERVNHSTIKKKKKKDESTLPQRREIHPTLSKRQYLLVYYWTAVPQTHSGAFPPQCQSDRHSQSTPGRSSLGQRGQHRHHTPRHSSHRSHHH